MRTERKDGRLKAPDGEVISYPDIPTVQEWIVLGKVTRAHLIYDERRRRWRPVSDNADLAAFFQLVEANAPWESAHSNYLSNLGR